ncbi:hypothetical protein TNIN_66451 [Trichonephila inaurata madagascariensis]|uniref:Uncharacterized protein n=1 Tax=Trichonephila inaurata madagascariensis TaxID=2747483 RepID=A0A8X6YN90_9ARAC|nr:hypothetical protein TNIN_66451 [Trichonephila inaurata madagascariensis]
MRWQHLSERQTGVAIPEREVLKQREMNDLLAQREAHLKKRLHKIVSYETTESIFDVPDDRFLMRFIDFFLSSVGDGERHR